MEYRPGRDGPAPAGGDADANGVPDMIQRPVEGVGASRTPRLGYQEAEEAGRAEATARGAFGSAAQGQDALQETRQRTRQQEFIGRVNRGLADRGGVISDEERDNLMDNARRMGLDEDEFRQHVGRTAEAAPAVEPTSLAQEAGRVLPGGLQKLGEVSGLIDDFKKVQAEREERDATTAAGREREAKARQADLAQRRRELAARHKQEREEIAAGDVVPEINPAEATSNAELAGRLVGGTVGGLRDVGEKQIRSARQLGGVGLRGLRGLRDLGAGYSPVGRVGQAAGGALQGVKRGAGDFSRGYKTSKK